MNSIGARPIRTIPATQAMSVQALLISVLFGTLLVFVRQRKARVTDNPKILCRFRGLLICERKWNGPKYARAEASTPHAAATTIRKDETRFHTDERRDWRLRGEAILPQPASRQSSERPYVQRSGFGESRPRALPWFGPIRHQRFDASNREPEKECGDSHRVSWVGRKL